MTADRGEMTQKLNHLNYENAELREKLEENVKFADSNELKKLQDECYDSKRKLVDVIAQAEDFEKKLQDKTEAHEKSLHVIKKACEHIEDLELNVERLKSSQPNSLSSTESAKNVKLVINLIT
jgi:protein subunit release factor A